MFGTTFKFDQIRADFTGQMFKFTFAQMLGKYFQIDSGNRNNSVSWSFGPIL
jgi:hypothetical protein